MFPVLGGGSDSIVLPVLKADFTNSIEGDKVTFTDASTAFLCTVDTYSWDFGDGKTSAEKNPVHTYAASGDYKVKLTVTSNLKQTSTFEKTITFVKPAPTANFTYSANYLEVTFTDTSTAASGNTITARAWNFGDGNVSTETNPVHTYANAGTYAVKLTVTDNLNKTSTYEKSITVAKNPIPLLEPNFTYTVDYFKVTFTDTTQVEAGNTITYAWDFGDSVKDTVQNPVHNYKSSKTFTVRLTVIDNTGQTKYIEKSVITATLPAVSASFTFTLNNKTVSVKDASLCGGAECPAGVVQGYSWTFGDSTEPVTGTTATHTYTANGTYTVTLTVTDVAGTPYTVSKDVNILIFDLVVKSMEGYRVTFEDKTVYPVGITPKKWTWEFGTEGSDEISGKIVEFLYQKNSLYKKVTLTVTDDNNETYSSTKDIVINYFEAVYAGKDFTIAKDLYNNLYGWGKNTYGQLGIGSTEDKLVPVKIPFPNDIPFTFFEANIFISDGFVLIFADDGKLYGWGRNDKGQLGLRDFNNRHTIQEIPMPDGVAGYYNFLVGDAFVIGDCSNVSPTCYYIWGANDKGQIGDGTNIDVHTPKSIAFPSDVTTVNNPSVGPASVYFSTRDSSGVANFLAWGDNANGVLGTGDTVNKNTPTSISTALGTVRVRFANANFVAAAHSSLSKTFSWGKNDKGQLGIGSTTDQLTPTEVTSRKFHDYVYGMENTVLALQEDWSYKVWGDNSKGQLGIGSTNQYESSPMNILPDVPHHASNNIYAGLNHILIWDSPSNKMYIWGSNEKGQIGLPGVGASLNTATHINTEKLGDQFRYGAAKGNHTFVISNKTYGLYATGANESGQLGTGDTTDKTEFTPVKFIP